ncbi:MAG: hypothetical protein ACTSUE_08175 [Promethearchaeota archaeon]
MVSFKNRMIKCPTCQLKLKAKIPTDILDEDEDGIGVVLIEPECTHKFIIFIDKDLKVRGYERIEYENVKVERADVDFVNVHIKELEKQHELMLKVDYNKAFSLLKELQQARKKAERGD